MTDKKVNIIKEIENLNKEQNYLENENSRLETIIDSQAERAKIKERQKIIQEKLLEMNINLLKSDEKKEEEKQITK